MKEVLLNGVNFRAYQEADAPAVIALLKETYGNGYIKHSLYNKEKINEYNHSGFIKFTVTTLANGEIIGIVGREKAAWFKNQCELVTQVIKTAYRCMNLSKPQLAFQINTVLQEEENYASLYSHILAYHKNAQYNVESLGFISCGFVLNIFDAAIFTVKGFSAKHKLSQTIAVRPHRLRQAGTLFVPQTLTGLIENIYQQLRVDFAIAQPETSTYNPQPSDMLVTIDAIHKHIEVCCYQAGGDFCDRIRKLHEMVPLNEPLWVINIYLNLKDEQAIKAYQSLTEMNYFFTGIQPLTDSGEFIVLHNPLTYPFDMTDVAYVASQNPFAEYIHKGAWRP